MAAMTGLCAVGVAIGVGAWLSIKPADQQYTMLLGYTTFLLGAIGAGATLFGVKFGLAQFEKINEAIYAPGSVALFLLLGGTVAVVLWLPTPALFTPFYSFGIGASWPAALQGIRAAAQAKKMTEDQVTELKTQLSTIEG